MSQEQVDMGAAQELAEQIASYFGASAFQAVSSEEVRSQCLQKGCSVSVEVSGETFALTGCGDGTCPSCPPGLGNILVRHWCAYTGVASGRAAIVLHLAFGATLGPFLV
jgi:hypothetical protein